MQAFLEMEDNRVPFVHKTHAHKKTSQESSLQSSFYHSYLIEKLAQLNEQKESTMDSVLNIKIVINYQNMMFALLGRTNLILNKSARSVPALDQR